MRDRVLISIDLEMTSPAPRGAGDHRGRGGQVPERPDRRLVRDARPAAGAAAARASSALTGIQPRDLCARARIEDVLPRLARFLDGAPLVAHTVSSDVGALARKGLVLDNLQLDTFELASIVLPRLESYSLASLVRHFGIAQTSQHRALPDAQVTRQLYLRLVDAGRGARPRRPARDRRPWPRR